MTVSARNGRVELMPTPPPSPPPPLSRFVEDVSFFDDLVRRFFAGRLSLVLTVCMTLINAVRDLFRRVLRAAFLAFDTRGIDIVYNKITVVGLRPATIERVVVVGSPGWLRHPGAAAGGQSRVRAGASQPPRHLALSSRYGSIILLRVFGN